MRAAVIHAPHDLRIETVSAAAPGPGPGQVKVRIKAGGICGSDLHYYQHGGFGAIRLQEPLILGHEAAGIVEETGSGVQALKPGMRVAINPSLACGQCRFCQTGMQQHCLDMRFYGSAMRFPHVQGLFRESLVCEAAQAHPVAEAVSMAEAAMAEPLAVCLHAANRAGSLLGKRVLITGCGPIGALMAVAARRAGAAEIIITDVTAAPLLIAEKLGADQAIDTARNPEAMQEFARGKGQFDVLFEASGASRAFNDALALVRPQGIIVQIGNGADFTLPVSTLVAKEIDWRGTFRFHSEFGLAVELLNQRLVDVMPLLTATLPLEQAAEAFALAGDRQRAMKVQLSF